MNRENEQHWTSDPEKLEAYARNRIDEPERAALAAHLTTCAACRARVQAERDLADGIRRFGRRELKRRLALRLRRDRTRRFEWTQVASIAAAVVLMLGAVFTIRWFTETQDTSTRTREIVMKEKSAGPAARSLWIIGTAIRQADKPRSSARMDRRAFKATKEDKLEPAPNITARRSPLSSLSIAARDDDPSSFRTLLEQTPAGLRLTVFTDSFRDTVAERVEAVAPDSIVVTFKNAEIAYHIPAGWAGKL